MHKDWKYSYKLPVSDFIEEETLMYFLDVLASVSGLFTCLKEPLENRSLFSSNAPPIPPFCKEHRHCTLASCEQFMVEEIKKSTFQRPNICMCPGGLMFIINPLILNQGASTGALVSGYFQVSSQRKKAAGHVHTLIEEDARHVIVISEEKMHSFSDFQKRTAEYLMQYAAIRDSRYDDCLYRNLAIARQSLRENEPVVQKRSFDWKSEKDLIDLVALGKRREAEEKLEKHVSFLADMHVENPREFKGRVMELAVVITRAPHYICYSEGEPINIRIPEYYPPEGYDRIVLTHWLKVILQEVLDVTNPPKGGNDSASIARAAIGYIDSHLASVIRLEDVTKAMGFSTRHLNRIFLEEIGISASEYFVRAKIQEAKHLMRYSQLSIATIAEKLNYWDSTHFAKMFRKVTGMSPREFRQSGEMPES
jgi:AraC-like DNA-binding protein